MCIIITYMVWKEYRPE